MFMKHLKGDIKLPTEPEMTADTEAEMELRKSKGYPPHYAHKLGFDFQGLYFNDLAKIAHVKPFPAVKLKIYMDIYLKKNRMINYKIIDDEKFSQSVAEK